ncbi:SOS response-associated peptidase family protein [Brevibacillus sp. NPDC003359]|uniref:SOS response-associated peptidase family protein n=1 Tax=unclassified Brevibacillus TaxID=2684853 RepID=UPI0036973FB7
MCGRFTLVVSDPEVLMNRYELEDGSFPIQARYNISPGTMIPAVINDNGTNRIGLLK